MEKQNVNRADAVMELKVNWSKFKPGEHHPAGSLLEPLHEKLREMHLHESLEEANDCTYVYYACGTCPVADNASYVEVYCNSSGGSQPDGWTCLYC